MKLEEIVYKKYANKSHILCVCTVILILKDWLAYASKGFIISFLFLHGLRA